MDNQGLEAGITAIKDHLMNKQVWMMPVLKEVFLAAYNNANKHPETFIPTPEHQIKNRPGIHQNDDGSKTFDYVTIDGKPCKIRLHPAYEGKIVDGMLQVTPSQNTEITPCSDHGENNRCHKCDPSYPDISNFYKLFEKPTKT